MPYLLCRIGWMETYASREERCSSRQKYIQQGNSPYEALNFLRQDDGYYRGYVPVGNDARGQYGRLALERLGASRVAAEVSGVTVIFCALHPIDNELRIVGFYKNASVLRKPEVTASEDATPMVTRIISTDAQLIPEDERFFRIPGARNGGMGQANIWYGLNKPEGDVLRSAIEAYINGTNGSGRSSLVEYRRRKLHLAWEGRAAVRHLIYSKGFRCEGCDYEIADADIPIWGSGFELHHLKPWAELEEPEGRSVTRDDFAVLCALCHKAIHRTKYVSNITGFRETIVRPRWRPTIGSKISGIL
ncbi:HNH endonuclease [Neoaquamicrobium sediminum]|uniref:HNH endonuclease n=1 Tax=Neoaquamicrobium sediminum TaxID=1849104 RepID=UPI003BA85970